MNLAAVSFPCLTPVPVILQGSWSPPPRRDWQGIVVAGEPLLAVAFISCDAVAEWYKSERGSANNLGVRLALFPYGADRRDVQVNFSVGCGGGRWRSVLCSANTLPVIPSRRELCAGKIEKFAEVVGEPSLELRLLLIARQDVKSARNGLWRVRKELAALIPEPFRRMLTYGRKGKVGEGVGPPPNTFMA